MIFLKVLGHLLFVTVLTVLTQVGGIIWVIVLIVSAKFNWKKRVVFPLLYLVFNIILIPPLAKQFGREALPVLNQSLKPINWLYPLAFRNYVTPELKKTLKKASTLNTEPITYLDANFPFFDGFPLLPHLSHDDGKKVDIAFQYQSKNGMPINKKPSLFGYGIFVNKTNPTSKNCEKKGYWQYNLTTYLGVTINKNLSMNHLQTKRLIINLLQASKNEKLFIEPYLKASLGLQNYNQIRFHGCQAVRHDDHIHLEIK